MRIILRKKIEDDPARPGLIERVRGAGYRHPLADPPPGIRQFLTLHAPEAAVPGLGAAGNSVEQSGRALM